MKKSVFRSGIVTALFLSLMIVPHFVNAQGVLLRSVGAVNESMGGVATATPIDSAGALFWNPASISALEKNEISIGLGIIMPEMRVSSTGTNPYLNTFESGSTKGDAGAIPAPSMSFVWRRCPKSPITYGISLAAVGGAASLYPADAIPMTTPSGEHNLILGGRAKSSTVIVMQVTPTVSYQVTDKLALGVAPIIDLASLSINPMQLGQQLGPQNEIHNYGTRYAWGGGFQIGAFYDFKNHFKTGFMFKSPIWAENLNYNGTTLPGAVVNNQFDLNLPMTLSGGISYDGIRDTIIGLDVRYFDYAHTAGFKKGINPATRIVEGLQWDSIFSIAVGVERALNRKLKVRMGYCWNENPIPGESSALNVAAPLMMQHVLNMGATYAIVKDLELSVAYTHAFKNKITGPGPAPITSVTNEVYANVILAGITKKW